MDISCCAWALSGPEPRALNQLAELGFAHIDVQTHTYATAQSQAAMDALDIQVRCVGLSFNMPEDAELDSPDRNMRQRAIAHLEQGLEQASRCGVDAAFISEDYAAYRPTENGPLKV